jgi:hypothetical protein
MADFTKNGTTDNSRQHPISCALCDLMEMDALDSMLSVEDQRAFDLHLVHCASCMQKSTDARRGAAWLEMLKSAPPQPSASLVNRILAQTSGEGPISFAATVPQVEVQQPQTMGRVLAFRPRFAQTARSFGSDIFHPRLVMTAAMAIFSIGLTFNLMGIRVTELKLADLKPANLRRTFYHTNAHVIRYYDNLRVVSEVESRVNDLRRDMREDSEENTPAPARNSQPGSEKPQPADSKPKDGGSSRRSEPRAHYQPVGSVTLQEPYRISASQAAVRASRTLQEGASV